MPGHHGWGPGRLYAKLNLTAEQQAAIKAIYTAARPQMQSLHATMKANHLKLTQTTPDDPNYATVVAEVAQSNAALASQRTTQDSEIKAQIYALLTPAQKTQLTTLEAEWAANPHQGHWGHRGPASTAPAT
jgi:Spy/CpxP family protein refolding chaperone